MVMMKMSEYDYLYNNVRLRLADIGLIKNVYSRNNRFYLGGYLCIWKQFSTIDDISNIYIVVHNSKEDLSLVRQSEKSEGSDIMMVKIDDMPISEWSRYIPDLQNKIDCGAYLFEPVGRY